MYKKFFFYLFFIFMFYGCSSLNDSSTFNNSENNDTDVTVNMYTLSFDSNGGTGSMDSLISKEGDTIKLPSNSFIRTGYSFTGWGITANGQPMYQDNDNITINDNITLFAMWIENNTGDSGSSEDTPETPVVPEGNVVITFNANEGEGYIPQLETTSGTSVQLSQNIFVRAGYDFSGWSSTKNGSVEYYDMQVVSFTESVTLYAVWKSKTKYTITFYSNTAASESKSIETYMTNDGISLPLNEYENGDKKFIGWSTNKDAVSAEYQDGETIYSLSGNLNLYAVWSSNAVTISFNPNGGTGTMNNIYANVGDVITIPSATFYKENYKLKGTYNSNLPNDIRTYGFGAEYTVEGNVEFITQWVSLNQDELLLFGGNSDTFKNEDKWVEGLVVKSEDWVESTIKGLFYVKRNSNSGWYDTYQDWLNLCWAGSSSNLLHWWHDRNKDNVDKYFDKYAPADAKRPDTVYEGWGISHIFKYFADNWPNEGYFINRALQWYLVGTDVREGGAFYKDIFGTNYNLVESYNGLTQYSFNKAMDKAFKEGMAVGANEVNLFGPHGITIWGAHFDENGFVDMIYVADSASPSGNNAYKGDETGIQAVGIVYTDLGQVYMKTFTGGQIPLTAVFLLSQGKEEWDNYFNTHSPLR